MINTIIQNGWQFAIAVIVVRYEVLLNGLKKDIEFIRKQIEERKH